MTIRVSILNGPDKDTQYHFEGEAVIGRSPECQLQLKEGTVSRQHARIAPVKEGVLLEKITSKGILKCDGNEVERIFLKHRQRVQCGAILLLVEDLSQNSPAIAVSPREGTPVQRDDLPEKLTQQLRGEKFDQEQTQTLGYPDEENQEKEGPTLDSARSLSYKRLVQVGGLVLLLIMAWKVFSNIEPPAVPQIIFKYEAGEEKLIDLSGYFLRYRIGDPSSLSIDRGDLIRAQLEPFSILRFKTLNQGDAILTLLDASKNPLLEMKFSIRGRVESTARSLGIDLMSEEKKLQRARTLMDQGRLVNRDNPYQAYLSYREAMEILEKVSTTHPLYLRCRDEMKTPKRAFEDRLENLWNEAARHRKNKSYDRALVVVDEILSMVGDASQLDYQRAQIYRKHILQRLPH